MNRPRRLPARAALAPSHHARPRRHLSAALSLAAIGLSAFSPASAFAANTVPFSTFDPGVTKSVAEWGIDTAWPSFDNVRQSVAHIGAANVDVARLTFHPAHPLTDNGNGTFSLSATARGFIDNQLSLAAMAGTGKPIALLPGEFAAPYDSVHWVRTIKATQEYINSRSGWTAAPIRAIEVFNEPDFWAGQGTAAQLNTAIAQLKAYPVFQNTAFPAASTLNANNARAWYDQVPQATQGSSHLLGGSMANYVGFMDYVKSTGKPFVNPELHSLGEAIVGAEHGMTSGIFWADVLRARGLFIKASDGKRLGYFEDIGRQSAAAVYRAPDGKTYAFAGGVERFGTPTSYRFLSTDRDVYFNGLPVREYVLHTKWDESNAANPPGDDFQNYGSWSNQGAYADVETGPGLAPLDGFRWKIVNAGSGQVMEVVNGGTGDGALIRSATDSNALHQKWNIVRTRNGYYQLYNANSGLTAEVANGSLSNNASVRQWGTADNMIQQWYIDDAGGGAFYLRNGHSNKYLTSSASNSFQTDNFGTGSQKWRFVLANPNNAAKAHYTFQNSPNDSAGAHHATVAGVPNYLAPGPAGNGQAITLNGTTDYVQLPAGIANSPNLTLATYVKWDGGNAWQRIFDFGNDTNAYLFLTPRSGDNTMRFAIKASAAGGEQTLDTAPLPIGQWVHLALSLGGNTGILYVDGKPRVAGQILLNPDHFNPTLNYLGRSQFNDPLFKGMIDEFRLYDYALDPGQVASFVFHRWTGELGANLTAAAQASPKNWQRNVAAADYANAAPVLFDDYATSFTVTIADTTVSPASTQFDNRNNNYTLNGPGTLAGTGGLTKNGAGAVTINAPLAYTGPTTVNGGRLTLAHAPNASSAIAINAGTLALTGPAAALAAPVTIAGAPNAWSGQLDLGRHALLVATAGGADKAARRATLLNQFAAGKVSSTGITSSTLPSTLNSALALADNADLHYTSFRGLPIDDNAFILVQATLGDATLDGKVDAFDLNLLASHWQQTANALWSAGDFNADGAVNAFDLNLLAANWQSTTSLEAALTQLPLAGDQLPASVPEPATLATLLLAAPALLTRRRQTQV